MTSKPPRRVPAEAAATPDEIAAAIESLTDADWARLKSHADYRIVRIGRAADRRDGDELLQTAITYLLEDTRRWNKAKVGFLKFLLWAITSISSNWAKGYKPEEALILDVDTTRENDEGEVFGLMDSMTDDRPEPRQQMLDDEKCKSDQSIIEAAVRLFADDQDAQMVLSAWEAGLDPTGVRDLWGLSQNDYNTIVRRIRRTVKRAGLRATGESNVQ